MEEKMQLQELKKAYDACRLLKENHALLLQQREKIEDQMITLQEEIEATVYKQQGASQERERLAKLKERLQAIDHQLDEHQDEELAELKKKLVWKIHHTFPSSVTSYQQLYAKLQSYREEEKNSSALYACLGSFHSAMNEGAASKKQRGIMGLFFGRNEQASLARAIQKAAIEAEKIQKNVNDENIQRFLKTFLEEANRPWNGKLYRKHFYELHHEFSLLMEKLEDKISQLRRHAMHTEKEIDIWIEHYSREQQ